MRDQCVEMFTSLVRIIDCIEVPQSLFDPVCKGDFGIWISKFEQGFHARQGLGAESFLASEQRSSNAI